MTRREALRDAAALSRRPWALFGTVVDYGNLFWQFSRREISGRHRGSLIGFGWAVLNPLLLLAIYTFVFSGCSASAGTARSPTALALRWWCMPG
jgi:ABC-type polysaccharide/polyol phosphate export permease